MRLTQRLMLGFGVVISLLIIAGIIITALADRTLRGFNQIVQVSQPISQAAIEMESSIANINSHIEEYLRTTNPHARQEVLRVQSDFEANLRDFTALTADLPEANLAGTISALFEDHRRLTTLRMAAQDVQSVLVETSFADLAELSQRAASLRDAVEEGAEDDEAKHTVLDSLSIELLTLRVNLARYVVDPVAAQADFDATAARTRALFAAYQDLPLNDFEQGQLNAMLRGFRWVVLDTRYITSLGTEIVAYTSDFFTVNDQLGELIEDQAEPLATRLSETADAEATEAATTTRTAVIVLIVFGIVGGLAATYGITQYVRRGFRALKTGAEQIGGGNLKHRIDLPSKDELGELASAFNSMAEKAERNIETLRVARREAEDANRMKDMFLATMSHELRTPLNAMIGFMHLMLFSGQLDEDNAHMANRSLANSQRLLSLINNMLDLSRIATGALHIVPGDVRLRDMVAALYGDMKPMAKDKGLALETEVDPDLPTVIHHDADRLMQIVTNLTHNAIKFTEAGSVKLSLACRGERLVIQVKDTGIGIPTSKQHLIFDDFFQVDPSSKRVHQGAGLGLAIVKRLVIMMEGSLRVESEVDQGSTFTVELPLNLPSRDGDEAPLRSSIFPNTNGSPALAPVPSAG